MKTVICALNSQYVHSSLAPWYLTAAIHRYSETAIQAVVIEGTINEKQSDLVRRIIKEEPQVLGFCCYIWNISIIRQLLPTIKECLPNTVIVLGGPEAGYNAQSILQSEQTVDFIVSGEGEYPFVQLLNAFGRGGATHNIPGRFSRQELTAVSAKPYTAEAEPPDPYSDLYFKALQGRIAYMETSRGCPYSCAFCLSGRCGNVQYFDLQEIKSRLLSLAKSGTRTIKLVDRTFNANRKRARDIFFFILDHYGKEIPGHVCFHFEIAGDLLDAQTIALLSSAPAGVFQFEIGLQSLNAPTLEAVNRKTDLQRLLDNIRQIMLPRNIHIHLDLIAGLPYEDLRIFPDSFHMAYNLKPDTLQLGFLKILHGSPMKENPHLFPCEYNSDPPYEVTATPWLTKEDLQLLHCTEDALNRLYNTGRFRRTVTYVLEQAGLSPFELFTQFGLYTKNRMSVHTSLDDYTAMVYSWFKSQKNVDPDMLRDKLVMDRLSTNASGKLPAVLRVHGRAEKQAKNKLEKAFPQQPGIRRGSALLNNQNSIVYVDYKDRHPVTGEYPLCLYPL